MNDDHFPGVVMSGIRRSAAIGTGDGVSDSLRADWNPDPRLRGDDGGHVVQKSAGIESQMSIT